MEVNRVYIKERPIKVGRVCVVGKLVIGKSRQRCEKKIMITVIKAYTILSMRN